MLLRCVLDGLILPAGVWTSDRGEADRNETLTLWAFDGDEGFPVEALEAAFYEVVSATEGDLVDLERAGYRFLRRSDDFRLVPTDRREKIRSCP